MVAYATYKVKTAMLQRVVPMIHVTDVRATVEWYKAIGFKVTDTYDDGGDGLSFAILSFGSSELMFNSGGRSSVQPRREADLYVYTDNIDDLYMSLKNRVDIVEGPHDTFYGMREFIFRDLNRFWITFAQEAPALSLDHLEERLQTQVNRFQRLLPPETTIACQRVASKIQESLPSLLASPGWQDNILLEVRQELALQSTDQDSANDVRKTPPTGLIIAAVLLTAAAIIGLIRSLLEQGQEGQEQGQDNDLAAMKEKIVRALSPLLSQVEAEEDEAFFPGRS
jgi:uncharacterized glyoxalase superfamily protein PhnB